jgi:hypothetical protein
MRRILGIIAIIAGLSLAVSWYIHRARIRALNSGDVFVRDMPADKANPRATAPTPGQHTQPQPAAAPQSTPPTIASSQPVAPIPASDSIPRNPPNGMLYAGGGKFQLYRQGDITWRLNTETGQACILFATEAQWSRTRVYQHGCANSPQAASATGN